MVPRMISLLLPFLLRPFPGLGGLQDPLCLEDPGVGGAALVASPDAASVLSQPHSTASRKGFSTDIRLLSSVDGGEMTPVDADRTGLV